MRPLKVLFVSPEVEPFVKVGGLADMVGALPKDLANLGHDVRIDELKQVVEQNFASVDQKVDGWLEQDEQVLNEAQESLERRV